MAENNNQYTGTWIPAVIMEDGMLSPTEKMLYAEIASFKKCYMSNEVLAARLGVSVRTVQNGLKKLSTREYIVITDNNNNSRVLSSVQNLRGGVQNLHGGVQNLHTKNTYKENIKETHTSSLRSDALPASSVEDNGGKGTAEKAAARRRIFDALVAVLHPGQSILYTQKRQGMINGRLVHFKPSQLVTAANNLMKSPWHTGDNPGGKKYADFDFLMKNDEQVEKWLNEKPVSKPKSVF